MYTIPQQEQYNKETQILLKNRPFILHEEALAQKIAQQLHTLLKYHDWRYYVLAQPTIQDIDYDYLFDTLKKIEQKYPQLLTPDSPTQRVAIGLTNVFNTIVHAVPMLSLNKAYQNDDLIDWDTSVKKLTEEEQLTYIVEPKFDGASIGLTYENDLLVQAVTRGNGVQGEEITNNARTIASIPLSAPFSQFGIYKAELRGEVVIRKDQFEVLNQERAKADLPLFSNSRNTAAGALRLKESSRVAERKLEAFIYQMATATNEAGEELLNNKIDNHSDTVAILYQLGFKTPLASKEDQSHICQSIEAVIAICDAWRAKRESYPYEIDGLVAKVNNFRWQSICGATGHHPKWAIALKFDARQATTKLEEVVFQVGRTGAITPVAKLKTVNLAGANISNASLHNEDFIRDKDIKVGDTVILERAGDVIPYIVEVVTDDRDGTEQEVNFPANCPACDTALVKPEEESVWRCANIDCPVQVEERVIHFVSKGAMDIRGLGKDIVKRFFKEGFISSIEDIYQLDYTKIQALDGWGEKSVTNLRTNIEGSKQQPLFRLLIGLGIREVGRSTARTLEKAVKDIDELKQWTVEQLQELPDIGPKVATNIIAFFEEEKNNTLIKTLQELGVNTKSEVQTDGGGAEVVQKLNGLSFLFTGTLPTLKRNEAKNMVEANGGKVISAVSKKLDYLVAGEKAGSKLKKAEKIETIKVIDEAAFLDMLV